MLGSDYNVLFLLSALPFFYILNKWIFPPFYCWLNTKLDYTVYYKGKDPLDPESYTTKGYALHNLIILPISFAFGFVLPVFLTKDSLAIFYIPVTFVMLWSFVGFYLRSDVFTFNMPSWSNPLELRDGTIIYGGAGYFANYYWLISVIPGFLFSFYGLIVFTYNYTITPFLIIGVGVQTLLWFPDKLNKFWPWDIRTWKGYGLLIIPLTIVLCILATYLY